MAISPPSDILLDVAAAADPAKVQAAKARLAALAADPSAANDGFSSALATAGAVTGTTSGTGTSPGSTAGNATNMALANLTSSTGGPHVAAAHGKPSVYTKFEAVMLQTFIQEMLPKDDELYGDKASAGMYRSMMAEHLANQISAAGGIGVAKSIEAAHPGGTAPAHGKSSA